MYKIEVGIKNGKIFNKNKELFYKLEDGMAKGRAEGKIEGKAELLLKLLTKKFNQNASNSAAFWLFMLK